MATTTSRGIRLFRIWGVSVYLHWTWFLAIPLAMTFGKEVFHSSLWQVWSIGAYLLLFVIVLLHEFGHALACRSVGGRADRIMLWPLGGLAYVQPPPRPGPRLSSIAAGPLVNVALLILSVPVMIALPSMPGDLHQFVYYAIAINAGLLIFNLIPVYPLDGGQLLRGLLWLVVGRAVSLAISGWIGIVMAGAVICGGIAIHDWWLAAVGAFGGFQSWGAIVSAKLLGIRAKATRHPGLACPMCHAAPPAGPYWKCSCGQLFDTVETGAACPNCAKTFSLTTCLDCGGQSPIAKWQIAWPLPHLAGEPVPATNAAR